MQIGPLSFHRKEQFDLRCWPWLCVHWRTANRSMRIFCVWRWGIQVRPVLLTRRALHVGHRIYRFGPR